MEWHHGISRILCTARRSRQLVGTEQAPRDRSELFPWLRWVWQWKDHIAETLWSRYGRLGCPSLDYVSVSSERVGQTYYALGIIVVCDCNYERLGSPLSTKIWKIRPLYRQGVLMYQGFPLAVLNQFWYITRGLRFHYRKTSVHTLPAVVGSLASVLSG